MFRSQFLAQCHRTSVYAHANSRLQNSGCKIQYLLTNFTCLHPLFAHLLIDYRTEQSEAGKCMQQGMAIKPGLKPNKKELKSENTEKNLPGEGISGRRSSDEGLLVFTAR